MAHPEQELGSAPRCHVGSVPASASEKSDASRLEAAPPMLTVGTVCEFEGEYWLRKRTKRRKNLTGSQLIVEHWQMARSPVVRSLQNLWPAIGFCFLKIDRFGRRVRALDQIRQTHKISQYRELPQSRLQQSLIEIQWVRRIGKERLLPGIAEPPAAAGG